MVFSRQTSDPRSGFATVEKELPGVLTPMLGDRKVSQLLHFLLIHQDEFVFPFIDIMLNYFFRLKITWG